MKRLAILLFALLVLVATGFGLAIARYQPASAASQPTPTPFIYPVSGDPVEEQVRQAIKDAIYHHEENVMAYLINRVVIDHVQFSADKTWATALLDFWDPSTNAPKAIEPGLAIARLQNNTWQVSLPSDPDWALQLQSIPSDLMPDSQRQSWSAAFQQNVVMAPTYTFSGYHLPWQYGITRQLTQSVGHDYWYTSPDPTCPFFSTGHYAFDFSTYNTIWDIWAAKAGTVEIWKDDVPTCYQSSCADTQPLGNYIIIKDTSTNPISYMLYLHLAQGSIPSNLKSAGAQVFQGQVIGKADNTGQSFGDHLHFMVHTTPNNYWGQSVDITFQEVDINGGRPREDIDDPRCCKNGDVCNSYRFDYTSRNQSEHTPPTGNITNLNNGDVIDAAAINVRGVALDTGSGLYWAQFVAYYGNSWHTVGQPFYSSPFSMSWDLCKDGVPEGLVIVGINATDESGNTAEHLGLRHLVKKYQCPVPPPPCAPSANQAALFSQANYQGSCLLLDSQHAYVDINSLAPVSGNGASLLLGANVRATLSSGPGYTLRSQTFTSSAANLGNYLINSGWTSSLRVSLLTSGPAVPQPVWPASGSVISQTASLSLYWHDGGGGSQFQAQIQTKVAGITQTITSNWDVLPYWHLGTGLNNVAFSPGAYFWQIRSKNSNGAMSAWSPAFRFTLVPATLRKTGGAIGTFFDNMESGPGNWTASGLWRLDSTPPGVITPATKAWQFNHLTSTGLNYDGGKSGDLTSPPITLTTALQPGEGYFLRFDEYHQTESEQAFWDQRWVQIQVGNGPFTNLVQLSQDQRPGYALVWQKPAIDISAYQGKTIRVRFHFDTMEPVTQTVNGTGDNSYLGWIVDNVSVSVLPQLNCGPADGNDSPAGATPLTANSSTTGVICPGSDVDYYKFNANAGENIVLDARKSPGSLLDGYLELFDGDGVSLLAYNDDRSSTDNDPYLVYQIPRNGTYYVRLTHWYYPTDGGPDYTYSLYFYKDKDEPYTEITFPPGGSTNPAVFVPGSYISQTVQVRAFITPTVSGTQAVNFFWHDQNFINSPDWTSLGSGTLISPNTWGVTFNPNSIPEQAGVALYASVSNNAGFVFGDGNFNLTIDRTPPTTQLTPLNTILYVNAALLNWSGSDNLAGLFRYDFQVFRNGTLWNSYSRASTQTQEQVLIEPGQTTTTYTFKLRGVDKAGNHQNWPASPAVSLTLPPVSEMCPLDAYENDNTRETASTYVSGSDQLHDFCNSEGYPTGPLANDEDWVKLDTQKDRIYTILALPRTNLTGVVIELYDQAGNLIAGPVSPAANGQPTQLRYLATQDGAIYIKMNNNDGSIYGRDVSYWLRIASNSIYFPFAGH